jgi:predicted unusual protein kinase regulating ubiquinone biosynthesis (AarF/ABC1/UbiB family)
VPDDGAAPVNGRAAPSSGSADFVIPPSAGKRIPIPLRPPAAGTAPVPPAPVTGSAANGSAPVNGSTVNGSTTTRRAAGKVPVLAAETRPAPARVPGTRKPASPPPPATPATGTGMAAMLPDVMAVGRPAQHGHSHAETIETQVNRLRPKTLRMQVRFVRTLVFALWLFGRLIFWQIYVARFFPELVNRRNVQRWRKYARQFRRFAIQMGGVMIKAGQFASTRADILPEEVIAELASLQDEVPTIPYKFIRAVLERELGAIAERYDYIQPEPIAAASLGQVHRAQLKNGDKVVVKVQRPGIREVVYTDMAALFIVARVAMRFGFVRRRADMVALSEEFGRVLLEEISYNIEMQHARRFHRMYAQDMGVYIPTIYEEHSTDFVLTIEDVTTLKINDYEALQAAGISRKEVARRLMDTYMSQIFEERFFHADPHPGNLFIYPLPVDDLDTYLSAGGGRPFYLIFIDFGMTGVLTRELVQGLINTLTAVITRDARRLVKSYQELGFLLPGADTRRIEEATAVVFEQVWGMSVADMTSMDFTVVQNIGREFNDLLYDMPFRVPQDFIYLGRTVGILTGMATALDPEFNPWTEIQVNVQKLIVADQETNVFEEVGQWLSEPFRALFAGDVAGFWQGMLALVKRFQQPDKVELLLQKLMDGDVALVTKLSPQNRRQLERLEIQGQRTTRAIIFATLMLMGTLFYTSGDSGLALLMYAGGGVAALAMIFIRQ